MADDLVTTASTLNKAVLLAPNSESQVKTQPSRSFKRGGRIMASREILEKGLWLPHTTRPKDNKYTIHNMTNEEVKLMKGTVVAVTPPVEKIKDKKNRRKEKTTPPVEKTKEKKTKKKEKNKNKNKKKRRKNENKTKHNKEKKSHKRFAKVDTNMSHNEPKRKGEPSKEDQIRHNDITNTVLELSLIAILATYLPISVLLSVGLLIIWKQLQTPGSSQTQDRYQCRLKCLRRISSSCITCRLALILLVLIAASQVTSAEIREKSEDILKPQFQLYYECYVDRTTKITRMHTKQKTMKSSKALRRLGKILQYKSNMDIISFSPSPYLLLVSAYNADFFGSIYSIIIGYIQDWRKKDTNIIA